MIERGGDKELDNDQMTMSLIKEENFKEAFEYWKKTHICNDSCKKGGGFDYCCASILEGRLIYLSMRDKKEDLIKAMTEYHTIEL